MLIVIIIIIVVITIQHMVDVLGILQDIFCQVTGEPDDDDDE